MNESTSVRGAPPWEAVLVTKNAANVAPTPRIEDLSARLLAYLRDTLADNRLDYMEPPSRMRGGSQAYVYRFELSGAPPDFSRPLILRLYPRGYSAARVVKESLVQDGLARQSYPVPRIYATCANRSILGGAFLIMELCPGDVMLRTPPETVPGMLAETQAALHHIDPRPILGSFCAQGWRAPQYRFEGELAALRKRAERHPKMRPVIDWLSANRPPEPEQLSICHGDFHPLNILVRNGKVTGVLDWFDSIIGDPALDVACTTLLIRVFGRLVLLPSDCERVVVKYLDAYRPPEAVWSRPL